MKNILFALTIILFSCGSPSKKEPQVEVKQDTVQDMGSENLNLPTETPTDLYFNSPRYWYIYYYAKKNVLSEYSGYKVIKIDEPYFDVYKAIKIICPSYVDGDYVGIQFFKEVSEKTYVEFNKSESK